MLILMVLMIVVIILVVIGKKYGILYFYMCIDSEIIMVFLMV